MDLTFRLTDGTFNFRAAAVMVNNGKLLVMQDGASPYWYLPGGRVHLQERAESALLRELQEELGIDASIQRPLWLVQNFFREDGSREHYHELGLYMLADISQTDLLSRGEEFITLEGTQRNTFRWIDFTDLADLYFYPLFLKREIFHLPKNMQLITEIR